jgi:hypothetical protein
MSAPAISLITFVIAFGGALLGTWVRAALPAHHLTPESKDTVRTGIGLIATTASLVLGLLIASAKSSFDTQGAELTEISSNVVLLDRVLAHYGPEAGEARDNLRLSVIGALDSMWSKASTAPSQPDPPVNAAGLYDKIQALSPKDDGQRFTRDQALSIAIDLGKMRWLMSEQRVTQVSIPLLFVLIFWIAIIFMSFGLLAPLNATAIVSLLVSALTISAAIFLIMEMYAPFSGMMQISNAPLRFALAQLGK